MNHLPDTLAEKVLTKIHTEHITPTSRGYFFARNAALWVPGICITLFGAFSWAGVLFSIAHSNWDYQHYLRPSLARLLWDEIPFVWIVLFGVFALFITHALKHTKHGYRWRAPLILAVSFCISLAGGVALYTADFYVENPLLHRPSERAQRALWLHPEEGRLLGNIEVHGTTVTLIDTRAHRWDIHGIAPEFFAGIPEERPFVRLLGTPETNAPDSFLACLVLPGKMERLPPPPKEGMRPPEPRRSSDPRCDAVLEKIRRAHRAR